VRVAQWTRVSALTMACALLAVSPVFGAEPFDGRWAADASACAGGASAAGPLVVTSHSLTWPGVVCTVGSSYRVRDAWHIAARCLGEGTVSNVAIKLTMRGERLVFDWARARPEELRRCP
jgi:hypothetical protein